MCTIGHCSPLVAVDNHFRIVSVIGAIPQFLTYIYIYILFYRDRTDMHAERKGVIQRGRRTGACEYSMVFLHACLTFEFMLPVLCGKLKTSTSTSFSGAHSQEYGAKLKAMEGEKVMNLKTMSRWSVKSMDL